MMVTVLLGALALGACVDDNESASVTAVRNAKAEQLKALGEAAKTQAEAEKIQAEAEKSYKEAWAKYYEAQAGYQGALTEEVMQRIEQSKIVFEAELETLKAEYDARLKEAQRRAAQAEQEILEQAEQRLASLYNSYFNALAILTDLQQQKIDQEFNLAQYKAHLATVNEYINTQSSVLQAEIDKKTLEIEAWKNYGGLDKSELEAQEQELTQKKYAAYAALNEAKTARNEAWETLDELLGTYNADNQEISTVKAVAAIQKYQNQMYYSYLGTSWEEANNRLQATRNKGLQTPDIQIDENGEYWAKSMYIWYNGENYYFNPFRTEWIEVAEWKDANLYSIYNEQTLAFLNNYYANGNDGNKEWLGKPASANNLATGLYLSKEYAEKDQAEAAEALAKAETTVADTEKALKTASDKRDAAKAATAAAQKAATAAEAQVESAQDAVNKLIAAGEDATEAQKTLDAAVAARTEAYEALNKAIVAENEANNTYYDADNAHWTAKNDLLQAKRNAEDAESDLARINDWIAKATGSIENFDTEKALWEEVVAALQDAAYAAEVKALPSNKTVVAYNEADEAYKKANDAYWEATDAVYVVNNLIGNSEVKDAAAEIRTLEESIANLEVQKAALSTNWNNGLESAENYERMITDTEAAVKALEARITVQQEIADLAKARVEAAIAEASPEN